MAVTVVHEDMHQRTGKQQQERQCADDMRQEAVRLRDPAYRAQQIERNREQGNTVTDAELIALSPRLVERAAELDRRADELAARAKRPI